MTNTFRQLSLDAVWNLSWNQAKKNFLVIFAINIIIWLCGQLSSLFANTTQLMVMLKDPFLYDNPDRMLNLVLPVILSLLPMLLIGSFIGWLASSYFSIARFRLLVDGVRDAKLDLTERIKSAHKGYLTYIITVFINSILIGLATCLCILPGIFLSVRLLLVPIIAANEPDLTLGEILGKSWNLTRGHFWTLLGYGIVAMLVNLVGLICCCVGVLFTTVVTQFMLASVYCILAQEDETSTEAPAEEAPESTYNKEEK